MPVDYKTIRERNIKEYGVGTRHLSIISDLYTTKTHFIFEILQNTEDALSRRNECNSPGYIHFDLLNDRLEIRHNGIPFSEKDITGICGIGEGTKSSDYTQIGKFGVGFKSVYAYTFSPQIYSSNEHFEIKRFVEPHELSGENVPPIQDKETCIVLPFDSGDLKPEWASKEEFPSAKQAVQEIGDALRKLGSRTLLFLKQIQEIKWTLPDGTSGHYFREIKNNLDSSRHITVIDDNNIEEWIVFSRTKKNMDGEEEHDVTLEVAFLLENNKVRQAKHSKLVVYFPTDKNTGLGFLIQGPFKTTKSRDNIKTDDFNDEMIKFAAQIAADSFEGLRDHKLLDLESFLALPLKQSEDVFFRPVYDQIREALKTKSLLPAYNGTFIKAQEAKLARGKDLIDVFPPEQINFLFGKDNLSWLDGSITEAGSFSDFHAYLTGRKKRSYNGYSNEWEIEPLIDGLLIDADKIAKVLTSEFMKTQDIDWLIKFIEYLVKNLNPFKNVPFIRLVNGTHVSLPTQLIQSTVYFQPKDVAGLDLSSFPIVIHQLAEHKEIREFLETQKVSVIDNVAIVMECILPKYSKQSGAISEDDHLKDIEKILQAYNNTDSQEKTLRLKKALKETPFILANTADGIKTNYKKPAELYLRNEELEKYFIGNSNVCIVSSVYDDREEIFTDMFKILGVKTEIKINRQPPHPTSNNYVKIEEISRISHKRGLFGYDPNIDIDGLAFAISNKPSFEKSVFIWNHIAIPNLDCIRGEIESSKFKDYHSSTKEAGVSEKFGSLLIDNVWLPGSDGAFKKPSELSLDDLPETFERNEQLAEQLRMKRNVDAKLAEQARISPKSLDLARQLDQNPDVRDKCEKELAKKNESSQQNRELDSEDREEDENGQESNNLDYNEEFDSAFNKPGAKSNDEEHAVDSGTVSNSERRREKEANGHKERQEKEPSLEKRRRKTERTILEGPDEQVRKNFEVWYGGRCQICNGVFRERDGKPFFLASYIVERNSARYVDTTGNALCLCAEHFARWKHGSVDAKDIRDQILSLKCQKEGGTSPIKLQIKLCEEMCEIIFNEKHLIALQELLKTSDSDKISLNQ